MEGRLGLFSESGGRMSTYMDVDWVEEEEETLAAK
jgi:hypothetical protein